MFKAVRDSILGFGHRIGTAWHDLRGRAMVRLFLFEFAVVLLGVLTAQALQSWSHEREIAARADGAIAVYDREMAQGLETAHIWQASVECVRDRVTEIMRVAADDGQINAELARRPGFWSTPVTPLSEEAKLQFRQRRSDGELLVTTMDAAHLARIADLADQVSREWRQFSRVDPNYGRISESDIAAARNAGANILSYLTSIEISADNTATELPKIGYSAEATSFRGQRVRPLANCAEMDASGAIYVLEPGLPPPGD